MQTDLFQTGANEDRSFPPHFDPARVSMVLVDEEEDRDHVAAAVGGILPVGALGNNRTVFVVRVLGKAEDVLHADSFASRRAADNYAGFIQAKLHGNRQPDLFADEPDNTPTINPAGDDLPLFST